MNNVRKYPNQFTDEALQLFHSILTIVENDEVVNFNNWNDCVKSLKNEGINMFYDTKRKEVIIPNNILQGNVYFKERDYRPFRFMKCIRDAYSHNYITFEDKNLHINLPSKRKNSIKLALVLSLGQLQKVVDVLIKNSES